MLLIVLQNDYLKRHAAKLGSRFFRWRHHNVETDNSETSSSATGGTENGASRKSRRRRRRLYQERLSAATDQVIRVDRSFHVEIDVRNGKEDVEMKEDDRLAWEWFLCGKRRGKLLDGRRFSGRNEKVPEELSEVQIV
jgi:hypothetical protein